MLKFRAVAWKFRGSALRAIPGMTKAAQPICAVHTPLILLYVDYTNQLPCSTHLVQFDVCFRLNACVSCCRQLYCCRSKIIVIRSSSSSSSIGMQSSAEHGSAVARNSSYCEAPTLRSNATTARLLPSMARLRGVWPRLQAAVEWQS